VRRQQFLFATLEFPTPGIVRAHPGEVTLQTDELGTLGLAVIAEPVGIDQPRPIVLRMRPNVLNEGGIQVHGLLQTVPRSASGVPDVK
jgi:hypothetical protein